MNVLYHVELSQAERSEGNGVPTSKVRVPPKTMLPAIPLANSISASPIRLAVPVHTAGAALMLSLAGMLRNNSGNNFDPNANPKTGAVYKGLAIATDAKGQTLLYVTNFRNGRVEMYDVNFQTLTSPPAFVDPKLPGSYAPFNIVPINGALFVTYAVQDAAKHDDVAGQGHGIVDVFELDGTMRQRFAQHGQLDSPWGVALTPSGFGELGGSVWIGNFGNGAINAYNLDSGEFLNKVRSAKGQAIVIDGLWTIRFGSNNGNGGATNTLYFTAGPNDETDGLFGSLNPN